MLKRSSAILSVFVLFSVLMPTAASAQQNNPSLPDANEIRQRVQERVCMQLQRLSDRFGDRFQLPPFCEDVGPTPEAPTVELTADPGTIDEGDSSLLDWDSENADTCTASGAWSGAKSLSGDMEVTPTSTSVYTLACSNETGTTSVSRTVTVIPAPEQATLTLVKIVINDDGGAATTSDFQAKINGQNVAWGVAHVVPAGEHTVSETNLAGYTASSWGGDCASNGSVTIAAGQDKTCTITNNDQPATLVVVKHLINDDGGSADVEDFSFRVNGGNATVFESDGSNSLSVDAGTYSVVEDAANGYTTSYQNCTNVAIPNGGSATCTITNDDNEVVPTTAELTLVKEVINNNGGTTTASAWTLVADGPSDISGTSGSAAVTNATVATGTYALSETGGPSGYSSSSFSCVKNGGAPVSGNSITLAADDVATCTITNNDEAGTLIVKKNVIRDDGGTAATTTFAFHVNNGATTTFEADGTNELTVPAGTHTVTEVAADGYSTSYSNCTNVFVPNGGSATCTITNNDIAPDAPTVSLTADPQSIDEGDSSELLWSSTNATTCTASGDWSGAKALSGTQDVSPVATSTYVLSCTGFGGITHATATIAVTPEPDAPTVSLSADPMTINEGATSTLTWSSTNATSCTASGDWTGSKALSGGMDVAPTTTSEYVLSCTGVGGTAHATTTVTVTPADAPTVSLNATPSSIDEGDDSLLTWSSTNATTCTASEGWTGAKALSGTATVTPAVTTDYVLSCSGIGGTAHATTTVSVTPSTTPMIGHVVISEVYYDVASSTSGTESSNEWIELYNGSSTAISLHGWEISDSATTTATTTLSSIAIEAGGYVVIAASTTPEGIPDGVPVFVLEGTIGSGGLANGGDAVVLYDPSGMVVDQIAWGTDKGIEPRLTGANAAGDGESIARNQLTEDTDTAADWEVLETPTPGM